MYRRALWRRTEILLNDELLQAVDPLFCHPMSTVGGAREYCSPLSYEIEPIDGGRTATVLVRFTELPIGKWHSKTPETKRRLGIVGGAGVSILRGEREIDYGWHLMGNKRKEHYDDWWRCEISFSPALDELFGVTHSKQGIKPTDELRSILCPDIESIARVLNSRARRAFARARASMPSKAVTVANRQECFLPSFKRQGRSRKAGDRLTYRITVGPLPTRRFFDQSCRAGVVTVRINRDHPFFGRLFAPIEPNDLSSSQFKLETLVLAAARAVLKAGRKEEQRWLERFLNDWSDALATFIKG